MDGMDLLLKNKTAFISGSTAGIGLATAIGLAKEGAIVYINSNSKEDIKKVEKQLASKYSIRGIAADLSTEAGSNTIIKELPEVDILINNLGVYEPLNFFNITDQEWNRTIDINVMSGIRLSRHYLRQMITKKRGRIIFVSSESGVMTPKEMIHYGVTKSMQIALARGLAELTVDTEITVNSVLAGPTKTPGIDRFVNQLSEDWHLSADEVERRYFETVRLGSLIKRFASPEEVANLVVYLSSPLSSATNGAAIRVEGGMIKSIL